MLHAHSDKDIATGTAPEPEKDREKDSKGETIDALLTLPIMCVLIPSLCRYCGSSVNAVSRAPENPIRNGPNMP